VPPSGAAASSAPPLELPEPLPLPDPPEPPPLPDPPFEPLELEDATPPELPETSPLLELPLAEVPLDEPAASCAGEPLWDGPEEQPATRTAAVARGPKKTDGTAFTS
ncbi:MAG: hypothetical protein M3O46_16975, partial [Myxococcota bacterium]|nr:hypothetical protein [Myxococcota bacterium]